MENYRVNFDESERNTVINILSRDNDIVINNIEPTSIGITIQNDHPSESYYYLLDQIERELRGPEGFNSSKRSADLRGATDPR